MTTADEWSSGLFQLRSPGHGIDLMVGHAALTRDALGQPLARLTLWLPEGGGSDGWEWAPVMYVLGNLVDTAVEVLFDYRADTGEISREGSFPLPSQEHDNILLRRPTMGMTRSSEHWWT